MAVEDFDSVKAVRAFGAKLDAKLQELAREEGVEILIGRVTYGGAFNFKITCSPLNAPGEPKTSPVARDFLLNYQRLGFQASDLGREFTFAGSRYKLVGCKPNSTKYPMICQNTKGKQYKLTVYDVQRALGISPTVPYPDNEALLEARAARAEARAEARMS